MLTTVCVPPRRISSGIVAPGRFFAISSMTGGPRSLAEGTVSPDTPRNFARVQHPGCRAPWDHAHHDRVGRRSGAVRVEGNHRIDTEPGLGAGREDVGTRLVAAGQGLGTESDRVHVPTDGTALGVVGCEPPSGDGQLLVRSLARHTRRTSLWGRRVALEVLDAGGLAVEVDDVNLEVPVGPEVEERPEDQVGAARGRGKRKVLQPFDVGTGRQHRVVLGRTTGLPGSLDL